MLVYEWQFITHHFEKQCTCWPAGSRGFNRSLFSCSVIQSQSSSLTKTVVNHSQTRPGKMGEKLWLVQDLTSINLWTRSLSNVGEPLRVLFFFMYLYSAMLYVEDALMLNYLHISEGSERLVAVFWYLSMPIKTDRTDAALNGTRCILQVLFFPPPLISLNKCVFMFGDR